jgi:hypothetical protein
MDLKDAAKLKHKVIAWAIATISTFLLFVICFLFQCTRPNDFAVLTLLGKEIKYDGMMNIKNDCFGVQDNGQDNKFVFDVSEPSSSGLSVEKIYQDMGQSSEWIDTGFVTNGKDLQVYVYGSWYPWGKDVTFKTEKPRYVYKSDPDSGNFTKILDTEKDYIDCPIAPLMTVQNKNDSNRENVIKSSNHLEYYIDNINNNLLNEISNQTAKSNQYYNDCIPGLNCIECQNGKCSPPVDTDVTLPCRLQNGAGLYLRIGEDTQYAYHLINRDIPVIKKVCSKLGPDGKSVCEYKYELDKNGHLKQSQIPFTLPSKIFNAEYITNNIYDIRDSDYSFITANNYKENNAYEFVTYKFDSYTKRCTTFEQDCCVAFGTNINNCQEKETECCTAFDKTMGNCEIPEKECCTQYIETMNYCLERDTECCTAYREDFDIDCLQKKYSKQCCNAGYECTQAKTECCTEFVQTGECDQSNYYYEVISVTYPEYNSKDSDRFRYECECDGDNSYVSPLKHYIHGIYENGTFKPEDLQNPQNYRTVAIDPDGNTDKLYDDIESDKCIITENYEVTSSVRAYGCEVSDIGNACKIDCDKDQSSDYKNKYMPVYANSDIRLVPDFSTGEYPYDSITGQSPPRGVKYITYKKKGEVKGCITSSIKYSCKADSWSTDKSQCKNSPSTGKTETRQANITGVDRETLIKNCEIFSACAGAARCQNPNQCQASDGCILSPLTNQYEVFDIRSCGLWMKNINNCTIWGLQSQSRCMPDSGNKNLIRESSNICKNNKYRRDASTCKTWDLLKKNQCLVDHNLNNVLRDSLSVCERYLSNQSICGNWGLLKEGKCVTLDGSIFNVNNYLNILTRESLSICKIYDKDPSSCLKWELQKTSNNCLLGNDNKYVLKDNYNICKGSTTIGTLGSCGDDPDLEQIGNSCYRVIKEKIDQNTNLTCPKNFNNLTMTAHPNELCAPPKGQRLYIKVADTLYDDNEGELSIIFKTGAKNTNSSLPKNSDGLSFSFVKDLLQAIISPLWGSQKLYSIEDNVKYERLSDSIIFRTEAPYYFYRSSKSGNILLVLSKTDSKSAYQIPYASTISMRGVLIKIDNHPECTNSSNCLSINYYAGMSNAVEVKLKEPYNAYILSNNIDVEFLEDAHDDFIKIDNMHDGLFVKIRNKILSDYLFQSFRLMMVVWFIFSFGFGIIKEGKNLNMSSLQSEWMRFAILLWGTEPTNYQMIDDFILPFLFRGLLNISTLFLEAASDIMGTSIDIDNPFDFFDQVLQIFFSKSFFIKLYSLSISLYFYLHFLIFPLIILGSLRMAKAVLSTVYFLMIAACNIGGMITFFPLYLVLSLTEEKKALFTAWRKQMIAEFLNLSVAMGIFGLFIGFIMHYLFQVIGHEVCWHKIGGFFFPDEDFAIFSISYGNWEIERDGSYGENVAMIIFSTFVFWMMSKSIDKILELSQSMANKIVGSSGGMGFNLQKAQQYYNGTLGAVVNRVQGVAVSLFSKGTDSVRRIILRNVTSDRRLPIRKPQDIKFTRRDGSQIQNQNNPLVNRNTGTPVNNRQTILTKPITPVKPNNQRVEDKKQNATDSRRNQPERVNEQNVNRNSGFLNNSLINGQNFVNRDSGANQQNLNKETHPDTIQNFAKLLEDSNKQIEEQRQEKDGTVTRGTGYPNQSNLYDLQPRPGIENHFDPFANKTASRPQATNQRQNVRGRPLISDPIDTKIYDDYFRQTGRYMKNQIDPKGGNRQRRYDDYFEMARKIRNETEKGGTATAIQRSSLGNQQDIITQIPTKGSGEVVNLNRPGVVAESSLIQDSKEGLNVGTNSDALIKATEVAVANSFVDPRGLEEEQKSIAEKIRQKAQEDEKRTKRALELDEAIKKAIEEKNNKSQ